MGNTMKNPIQINSFTPFVYLLVVLSLCLMAMPAKLVAENDSDGVKVLYKKVDKNGRITFTDKETPGAKKITVNTRKNVLAMPKKAPEEYNYEDDLDNDKEKKKKPFKYSYLAIESPKNDESIRANDGGIYVVVGITPQLRGNHSVRLLMNGSSVAEDQKVPYFSLANIDRGTHKLQVQIIEDSSQKIIQSSPASSFHLQRMSLLQSNQRR